MTEPKIIGYERMKYCLVYCGPERCDCMEPHNMQPIYEEENVKVVGKNVKRRQQKRIRRSK